MKIKLRQQGSIILEVLIAASIFAVALIALVDFQSTLLQNRGVLNQRETALELAENQMDLFRSYTSLAHTNSPIGYTDITNNSTTASDNSTTYTLTWTVTTNATATDYPIRKNVHMVVTWTDAAGNAYTSTSTNSSSTNSAVFFDTIIAQLNPTNAGQVSQEIPQ